MSLQYFYLGPPDLLNKLEREASRLLHAAASSDTPAMCDHFFNFCITAHSLRDWIINSQIADKQLVHNRCNQVSELAACRDIANSSKHFALKIEHNTIAKGAVVMPSKVLDVFEDASGAYRVSQPRDTIDISLTIEGRPPQESHQFTRTVIAAWKIIFEEFGLSFESIYKH